MSADITTPLSTWSATEASNQPDNSDAVGPNTLADNLRRMQSVLRDAIASDGTIASATTTDLSTVTAGYIVVTGTTTITALGTVSQGIIKILKFSGALTFTHNATSLILSGGASRTTAAGDVSVMHSEGSGNWREIGYTPASNFAKAGANADITSLSGISNITLGDTLQADGSGVLKRSGIPHGFHNATLSASVGSSALTINLLDPHGATPAAATPVYVNINGTVLAITAATSIVVSSGSTLGTLSAFPSRVWVVGFNDAGTFRMGVINCANFGAGGLSSIYPLRNGLSASSTAEGGAGAADNGGVFYTGTAVSAKDYIVLGYVESTQATAGTWATSPSNVRSYVEGVNLPGEVVQLVNQSSTGVATGTTSIPRDDTIPQNTEGDQYMSAAITPVAACNLFRIVVVANVAHSSSNVSITGALFQDSIANAIAAVCQFTDTSTGSCSRQLKLDCLILPGLASALTFKFRAGGTTGSTITFNGSAGNRLFGGVMNSNMRVEEVAI